MRNRHPSQRPAPPPVASVDRRGFLKACGGATAAMLAAPIGRALAAPAAGPFLLDVSNVPVPDFTAGNLHRGVEVLLRSLHCGGFPLYRAPATFSLSDPVTGLVAANDVVLIKVNGQWQYRGITSSDVLRGVIQRILDHPEGFTGEVVLVENGQGRGSLDGRGSPSSYPADGLPHANAEDPAHTFRHLVDNVFDDPRVSAWLLDPVRSIQVGASDHSTNGYRRSGFVSYPCFTTARGTRVELKDGIWDGTAYRQDLKLINLPVLKTHGGSAMTGALKHTYGLLSMAWNSGAYHYAQLGDAVGDMHTLIRTPVLNLIDCTWVSPGALAGYPSSSTVRTDRLLAGFDPVALDYYAGKHVLYPAGGDPYHDPDSSTDYRNVLLRARDRINSNGGIRGQPVTFDEAQFQVLTADASVTSVPMDLRATRSGGDVRLDWQGGQPPYRVWRSATKDFSSPELLTGCAPTSFHLDAGALANGRSWYYRVE